MVPFPKLPLFLSMHDKQDTEILGKLNFQSLAKSSHGQNSELFRELEIRPRWSAV